MLLKFKIKNNKIYNNKIYNNNNNKIKNINKLYNN